MKIFSRNKVQTDPASIINSCLYNLFNRISDSLNDNEYQWNKPWGVKRFESLVLSKFFMEYSFNIISEDKLADDEKTAFTNLCDTSFEKYFNDEFSSVGLNYENMKEDIQFKIDSYFDARRNSKPPNCWHAIYKLITKSKDREEIQDEIKNKLSGLELIKGNENFESLIPQYELQINNLKIQYAAFESAEMMFPHMARFTKDKLRTIKLKKIKNLSKKLAKQNKSK